MSTNPNSHNHSSATINPMSNNDSMRGLFDSARSISGNTATPINTTSNRPNINIGDALNAILGNKPTAIMSGEFAGLNEVSSRTQKTEITPANSSRKIKQQRQKGINK